ncbi:MAG: sugar transferase [Pseudomonadota bacterium]|nr:sugar transferase [Pseudomonadota bacterium]MEE3071092.1 sugar transferase [Pseudomonadota bacterium]
MSFHPQARTFRAVSGPVENPSSQRAMGSRNGVKTGFAPRHAGVHRLYNAVIAAALISVSLPLFVTISVALLLTQGPGIIYRGERIGLNGKSFNILKFRTLDNRKAAELTSDKVLPADSNIETPLGRYLRASRLDEMPQLFNVLMGHMNMVGPRPVRKAIADIERLRVPNYDHKFRVKPGLVGHSQAYMTHGTSKRIRARYNNMLVTAPVNYRYEMALFAKVGLNVLLRAAEESYKRLTQKGADQIAKDRARRMQLALVDQGSDKTQLVTALSANTLVLRRPLFLARNDRYWVEITLAGGRVRRAAVALTPLDGTGTRFAYSCRSDAARYMIERYVLDLAVVGPSRPTGRNKADTNLQPAAVVQPA